MRPANFTAPEVTPRDVKVNVNVNHNWKVWPDGGTKGKVIELPKSIGISLLGT